MLVRIAKHANDFLHRFRQLQGKPLKIFDKTLNQSTNSEKYCPSRSLLTACHKQSH